MHSNGAVVVATDVARRYGEGDTAVDALRGVSLDDNGGQLTTVMGPSGAGKSTALRIIAGLRRPDPGRITVNGMTWFDSDRGIDLPPERRACGLMFQEYALFPHRDVTGNVEFGLRMARVPRVERARRVDEVLALEYRRLFFDCALEQIVVELGHVVQSCLTARLRRAEPMMYKCKQKRDLGLACSRNVRRVHDL